MLPISISNSRDLQRSDAKLSSDRSVKGHASQAAQSFFLQVAMMSLIYIASKQQLLLQR